MDADSQLFLFELDPAFSRDLERQFADDPRVHVINRDAASLSEELARRGIAQCDYILSGIPFSILEIKKKRALLQDTYDALRPGGAFIIYQVTNELRQHATFFDRAESEYCLQNIPPMFITVFQKAQTRNGHARIAPPVATNHRLNAPHERLPDPDRKGFDGRNVRPGIRPLRRLDPAGRAEFSGQRLAFFSSLSSARWAC